MSNFQPQNIKGVVAFPNEEGNREIRFIDSKYNILFTVPDGSNIILTPFEGEKQTLRCEYIDDYHAQIGNVVYHVYQFAEVMEQKGAVYMPEHPREGDVLDTYELYQLKNKASKYRFMPYIFAGADFCKSDYKKVYQGMLAPVVETGHIYDKHNQDDRPFGNRMHSLSVSDVIVENRNGRKRAFYVERFGFTEVPQFLEMGKKTKEHQKKKKTEPER